MKFTTTLFALTAIVPTVLGGGFAATCNNISVVPKTFNNGDKTYILQASCLDGSGVRWRTTMDLNLCYAIGPYSIMKNYNGNFAKSPSSWIHPCAIDYGSVMLCGSRPGDPQWVPSYNLNNDMENIQGRLRCYDHLGTKTSL